MLGGDGDTRSAAETGNWFINTDEYRNALVDYLRHGDQDMRAEGREALTKGKRELRDQAKGTNTLGGFLVPIDFQKKLALHAVQSGTMRMNRAGQGALVTGTGEALQIPKTTVYGQAEWVSEGSPSTSDDSSFGQLTLNAFTARRLVKVSVELVEDNAVDLVGHLSKAIGQSIGRLENTAYWNGSGTGQPTGLITALQTIGTAAKGKVGATGQTTSITADDILDLFYSVGPQYRINGEWALNDMTVKAVRKLKDATGNYLFSTTPGVGGSLAYSAPDTLQGKPLWSDPDIPQMASNAWSVVFGDMSAYQLRDVGVAGPEATERPVGAFSVIRLNERFMDGLQIGFLGYHRTDGGLIDQTGAIKAYVNSAT
jgi:HK97 family phage major capsid protein